MNSKAKPFNQFARAKHSGVTPYRPNFNLKSYKKTRKLRSRRILGFTETDIHTNNAQVASVENPRPVVTPAAESAQEVLVEEPPNGPTFQRKRLTNETERLAQLANKWNELNESENVPDYVRSDVDAVVGGTRLLVSSKFQQFSSLIDNAKNYNGEGPAITPDDLDGFWDMMSIQIRDLDVKFEKLETAMQQGWPSVEPSPAKRRSRRQKARKPRGVSKFKEFLMGKLNL